MHPDDGELRSYLDQQLSAERYDAIQAHLAECARCVGRMDSSRLTAGRVDQALAVIRPDRAPHLSAKAAHARFESRLSQSSPEVHSMSIKLFSRQYRPAWVALVVVVLLAISLAFAPVRAIANSFLGLFRVQQVAVVQVNPANLPDQLGSSASFEAMFNQDIQLQESGESQPAAGLAEASALAGFAVRLPVGDVGTPELTVQPGGSAVFNVNLEHVRLILNEIGRSDIKIPKDLDGAEVRLEVPASVLAQYGECRFALEQARQEGFDPDSQTMPSLPHCTSLVQMPSPTISAPPGLDLSQIGRAYLQLMGLTAQEAEAFARNVDWTSTFVIPIPRYGTRYTDVPVDGVTGTLIQQEGGDQSAQYVLLWVKDGIVYALTGPGEAQTALQIARTIK